MWTNQCKGVLEREQFFNLSKERSISRACLMPNNVPVDNVEQMPIFFWPFDHKSANLETISRVTIIAEKQNNWWYSFISNLSLWWKDKILETSYNLYVQNCIYLM